MNGLCCRYIMSSQKVAELLKIIDELKVALKLALARETHDGEIVDDYSKSVLVREQIEAVERDLIHARREAERDAQKGLSESKASSGPQAPPRTGKSRPLPSAAPARPVEKSDDPWCVKRDRLQRAVLDSNGEPTDVFQAKLDLYLAHMSSRSGRSD
jgi:hypothetical protein